MNDWSSVSNNVRYDEYFRGWIIGWDVLNDFLINWIIKKNYI